MSAHVADPEVDIILFNEKKKYNVQLHPISKFYFVIFVMENVFKILVNLHSDVQANIFIKVIPQEEVK